jgi:hypothetical protein
MRFLVVGAGRDATFLARAVKAAAARAARERAGRGRGG